MAEPATSPASTPAASPTPVPRSAPASPAPSARPGVVSDAHYDNLPDGDRDRFARVRKDGVNGGSEWRERSAEGDDATPAAADGKASIAEDGRLKVGEMLLSESDIRSLMATRAEADLRATQIPADGAYEARLPEGLQLPEGVDFKIDTTDPAFNDLRTIAKKMGWTQEDFSNVLALHVSREARKEAEFRAAMQAEIAELGPNATMRVTALNTWLRSQVGDDVADSMRAGMFSEKIVRGLETIATKMMSGGAASFSQSGRIPPEQAGRVSNEEYSNMSSGEKLDYARRFPQSQFNGGR